MSRTRKFAALVVLALAIACSKDATTSSEPSPQSAPLTGLVISLATPNSDDGALALTLHGPDIGQIAAASSHYLAYTHATSSEEAHVIIVGNIAAGQLLTVPIGAGHKLSDYSASVSEVAARNDSLRATLSNYQLTLAASAN